MSDPNRTPKKLDYFSTRLPPRPLLDWGVDGVPRDQTNDDVYFSVSNGLEETREVFFKGCGLPERWLDKDSFTIAELGFGTGLNIVALMQLWRANRPSSYAQLNVVSFEGRLMAREDAALALKTWPELSLESRILLENWPERARGIQRIDLGSGVILDLHQDEIFPALQNAKFLADAWFLDGFSPAKNPEMWSKDVMLQIAAHSAPCAVIGTYTVAGHVRRALSEGGFQVSKQAGFGTKRDRLEAIFPNAVERPIFPDPLLLKSLPEKPLRVVIIGAGIMGACLAHAFEKRGCDVTVLDKAAGIDEGASANPLGLVAPRLDGEDTPQARLLIDAYLSARTFYKKFQSGAWPVNVEHFSSTNEEVSRHAKIKINPPLDTNLLETLEGEEGQLGLNYFEGIAVSPTKIRTQLLANVKSDWGAKITAIETNLNKQKSVYAEASSGEITEYIADLVVVASGMGFTQLFGEEGLPIRGRAGQLESIEFAGKPFARSKGQYVVAADNQLVFGATYQDSGEEAPNITAVARAENFTALEILTPEIAFEKDNESLISRTAVRAVTPDQLPFAGRLPRFSDYRTHFGEDLRTGRRLKLEPEPMYQEGLYAVGGLGSRGLTWAPFLAQIIVADAFGDPVPTGADSRELIAPARFFVRQLKREKPKK